MLKNTDFRVKKLENKAEEVRRGIVEMISNAKSGHLASSLSVVEILVTLYYDIKTENDTVILSKGYAAPALYTILIDKKIVNGNQAKLLRDIRGILEGHPGLGIPGVDAPSGSLGVGFSVAVGRALGRKLHSRPGYVYCITGDGELQEGICWELLAIAFHHRLDNLIVVVDRNGLQLSGVTENILSLEPLERKLESLNWYVEKVDGHNIRELLESFERCRAIEGFPKIIIADTMKGKGIREMEWNVRGHSMKTEEIEAIIRRSGRKERSRLSGIKRINDRTSRNCSYRYRCR